MPLIAAFTATKTEINLSHVLQFLIILVSKKRSVNVFSNGVILSFVADIYIWYLTDDIYLRDIFPTTNVPDWGVYSISQEICTWFCLLCFVVVIQSFIMNSHEVFIHIHQGCFAGTGAIVRLPQCQWSKPDEYGKISQCITKTKHSKAKTVCIFLGIYCIFKFNNIYMWP